MQVSNLKHDGIKKERLIKYAIRAPACSFIGLCHQQTFSEANETFWILSSYQDFHGGNICFRLMVLGLIMVRKEADNFELFAGWGWCQSLQNSPPFKNKSKNKNKSTVFSGCFSAQPYFFGIRIWTEIMVVIKVVSFAWDKGWYFWCQYDCWCHPSAFYSSLISREMSILLAYRCLWLLVTNICFDFVLCC